jgi:hypothetical protein
MGDTKPTEIAQAYFDAVVQNAVRGSSTNKFEPRDLAYSLSKMCEGLGQMAVGLRATYILLGEVKELLQRQK